MSVHYDADRNDRQYYIDLLGGDGNIITKFYVDRNHADGPEIHCITDNAIIIIYNALTNKLVTKLIARPGQIKRYYKGTYPPKYLLDLAYEHLLGGYNEV
jgi:hypothetical protein